MHNFLFKLKFNSAVRFGFDRASGGLATSGFACHADTLFSALCHEWLNIYGEKEMLRIAETASTGIFLISDMFPWEGSQLYLPKPIVYVERVRTQAQDRVISDRKRLKDLHYIPVTHFKEYIEFLKEGGELSFTAAQPAFEFLNTRAYVGRGQETMPYIVSSWRFKPDSGLYFILRTRDREIADLIEQTLGSLGISGIGGKKSTGLGKFELAEDPIEFSGEFGVYDSDIELGRMMEQQGDYYMSLSIMALSDKDFAYYSPEKSYYTLIYRTGFVYSHTYSQRPLKKKGIAMFAPGSCFENPFEGLILDVSDEGTHKVFRYGKGMYVGVKI